MLRKLAILGTLATLLASAAGGITVALASGGITQPETIIVISKTTKGIGIDLGKKGFGPGDQFLFRDVLLDETGKTRMGADHGQCTASFHGWQACQVALFITDRGEITAYGAFAEEAEEADFPLTGGTGDFDNVRGSAHVEFLSEIEARITLSLLP